MTRYMEFNLTEKVFPMSWDKQRETGYRSMLHTPNLIPNNSSASCNRICQPMFIQHYSERHRIFPIFHRQRSWSTVVKMCMYRDGEDLYQQASPVRVHRI